MDSGNFMTVYKGWEDNMKERAVEQGIPEFLDYTIDSYELSVLCWEILAKYYLLRNIHIVKKLV